jgi:uncharacterized repeat protein (TIGR01451 family)
MKRSSFVLSVVLLLAPTFTTAQQQDGIEVKTIAEIEVVEQNAKGEKVKVRKEAAQAKVVPDDIIIFTTTYVNKGREPATGVAITNPIAPEMSYVAGSAEGKGTRIEFSVDNGKTFASPEKLIVRDPKGGVRKAAASDYTAVKWTRTTPLAPAGTSFVRFRARVK